MTKQAALDKQSSQSMSAEKQRHFAAIFRQHARALQNYVRHKVRSREAAEDIVQETFARAYACGFDALASPRNFLFRSAHNLAVNHRRNLDRSCIDAVPDIDALGAVDTGALPEETLQWRHELEILDRLIDSLPQQCRQVFILQKLELHSHKEIAEQLGITISTVEKHIARAVKVCYQHFCESLQETGHGR